MLTFENAQHLGATSIMEKLIVSEMTPRSLWLASDRFSLSVIQQGLPFQRVAHQINTTDVQPTVGNCFIVLVTGLLAV